MFDISLLSNMIYDSSLPVNYWLQTFQIQPIYIFLTRFVHMQTNNLQKVIYKRIFNPSTIASTSEYFARLAHMSSLYLLNKGWSRKITQFLCSNVLVMPQTVVYSKLLSTYQGHQLVLVTLVTYLHH